MKLIYRLIFVILLISVFLGCDDKSEEEKPVGVWEIAEVVSVDGETYAYPYSGTVKLSDQDVSITDHSFVWITDEKMYFIDRFENSFEEATLKEIDEIEGRIDGIHCVSLSVVINTSEKKLVVDQGFFEYNLNGDTLEITGRDSYKITARKSGETFPDDIDTWDYPTGTGETGETGETGGQSSTAWTAVTVNTPTDVTISSYYGYVKADLTAGTTYYLYYPESDSYVSYSVYKDEEMTYSGEYTSSYYTSGYTLPYKIEEFTPSNTGTYYFKFYDDENTSVTFNISDSAPKLEEDATIEVGSSASVAYVSGKSYYYFKASLTAGTQYFIHSADSSDYTVYDSEMDTVSTYTAAYNLTTSTNDPEFFTPSSTGDYLIIVYRSSNPDDSQINLKLSTSNFDESVAYTLGTDYTSINNIKRLVLKISDTCLSSTKYYVYTDDQASFSGYAYYNGTFSNGPFLYGTQKNTGTYYYYEDDFTTPSSGVVSPWYVVLTLSDTDINSKIVVSTSAHP